MKFWSGNIAFAEGALKAGCRFYAGYPITPSSDLMEHMASKLPEYGGIFIQAEDEIASVNMIIGASIAGLKSMTATSGPGFSLMQEGIGYAVMTEVPIVIVDITRLGPSTGQATKAGQGDLMQARWGRHGDQYLVVLSASSVQDCYLTAIRAFNVSEKFRVPVVVLIDELIGHLWESVEVPEEVEIIDREWTETADTPYFGGKLVPPMPKLGKGLNVLYTGSTHDEWGYRKTQDPDVHRKLVSRIKRKIMDNASEIFKYRILGEIDGDVLFVAYGSPARSCREAVIKLAERGIKAGLILLDTLWPIDYKQLGKLVSNANKIIVPELSLGQLIYDILIVRSDNVYNYHKIGGGVPIYPNELVSYALEVLR